MKELKEYSQNNKNYNNKIYNIKTPPMNDFTLNVGLSFKASDITLAASTPRVLP